jgi:hypothetical protein
MTIVFGFRTPSAQEVPTVLYIGDNGDEANKVCDESAYPRIAMIVNPTLRPIKHWTEEASEAFEKHEGKKLGEPIVTNLIAEVVTSDEQPTCEAAPAENLDELTVEQLKKKAAEENVDLKGKHTKAEIIDAIKSA